MEQKMEYYIDSTPEGTLQQPEEFLPEAEYPVFLDLDHPSVKKVIQIALKLAKEHRIINKELLYNRAKKELKIPKQGLHIIIQMLFNSKMLINGSIFTKETVLKNEIRSDIYCLVKTDIGVHFSSLKKKIAQQKKSEIGVGQLKWHLEKLIAFNLIREVKVMNYTLFLPTEFSEEEAILYFVFRDDLNKEIVEFLIDHEPAKKSDLYNEFNGKRGKIYYRVKKLIKMNIISALYNSEDYLSLNREKREEILRVINAGSNSRKLQKNNKLISIQT